MISPSRVAGPHDQLVQEAALSLKKEGNLFIADLVDNKGGTNLPGQPKMHSDGEYRGWAEAAGLKLYSVHNMTDDARSALLRGLHHSLNMLANARKLQEPWRAQRLKAFQQELEFAVALHLAMDRGDVAAMGLLYTKPA